MNTLRGHTSTVMSLAFNPSGSLIVSSGGDSLKIWDVSTKECLITLYGNGDKVVSAVFIGNGIHIVSASVERTIKIWN